MFLVGTSTEIRSLIQLKVWDKLGLESHRGKVIIRGKEVVVELSTGKLLDGINLLGMDTLYALGLKSINYNWEGRKIILEFADYHVPVYNITAWSGSESTYGWDNV